MKLIKKLTMLCLALISAGAIASFAACNEENGGSSLPDVSSSQTESSADSSIEDSSSSEADGTVDADWNEWVRTKDPTCVEDGEKQRTLIADPTKVQTAKIPARGHNYAWTSEDVAVTGEQGLCIVCNEPASIPALDSNQAFAQVDLCTHNDTEIYEGLCDCVYKGRGEAYSRVELSEGCYTLEIPSSEKLWLSFSVKAAGQYVLYSVDGDNDVVAQRYNAEVHYVNENGGIPATVKENNFFSYVNCGTLFFSEQWRATYSLEGEEGTLVKICFARVADPTWAPGTVNAMVYPTEINGKKADDGKEGEKLVAADYNYDYFYDETVGYYRRGTKSNPGEILYAAITKKAERIFGDRSFIEAFAGGSTGEGFGAILYLTDGSNADGDNIEHCYIPFLYNCKDDNNHANGQFDLEKNCYMNFCNADGVYPVTRELYTFLNRYVRANQPVSTYDDRTEYAEELARDWTAHKNENGDDEDRNRFWLLACYYYKRTDFGVEDNPLILEEGSNVLNVKEAEFFHATLQSQGLYKITYSGNDLSLQFGSHVVDAFTEIVVQAPVSLEFFEKDFNACTATITVTKIAEGTDALTLATAKPVQVGDVTLATYAVYAADGSAEYIGYYAYTPTAAGNFTLTLTGSDNVAVTVGSDATATQTTPSVTVTVTEEQVTNGETLYIYVSTDGPAEITATLAFA